MSNFDPNGRDDLTGGPGAFIHPTGGLSARDNNNFDPRSVWRGILWTRSCSAAELECIP